MLADLRLLEVIMRRTITKTKVKSMYFLGACLLMLASYYVHGFIQKDAFVVRTVNIFPIQIEGEGWLNLNTITHQDVSDYALRQDFSIKNSATLDKTWKPQTSPVSDIYETDEQVDVVSGSEDEFVPVVVDEALASSTVDSLETQTETVEVIELQIEEGEESIEPVFEEIQSPEPIVETVSFDFNTSTKKGLDLLANPNASTYISKVATTAFAFLIGEVTDEAPVVEDASFENVVNSEEGIDLVSEEMPVPAQEEAPSVIESAEDVVNTNTTESSDNLDSENIASESDEVITPEAESQVQSSGEISEDEVVESGSEAEVVCDGSCAPRTITMTGFGFPLDEGTDVGGAQLRLSLAGDNDGGDFTPELRVQYTVGEGANWRDAGLVKFDDEVSNSINGGYYLFSLQDIKSESDLESLKVQLVVLSEGKISSRVFVESAWLELFVIEPPVEMLEGNIDPFLGLEDGYQSEMLSGDELTLPEGEEVEFKFTDENEGETLIIKSSEKTFKGLAKSTTHFSVTNTSDRSDSFTIQTYFPDKVGEVIGLKSYNQNKARVISVPERRPFVYHCEAGWTDSVGAGEEISSLDSDSLSEVIVDETSTSSDVADENSSVDLTEDLLLINEEDVENLAQEATIEDQTYTCRNTNITRTCDSVEEDNTVCRVEDVLVREHEFTTYAPGWDELDLTEVELPRPGIIRRLANIFGGKVDEKEIPESFEMRARSNSDFAIAPGETLYFEMEIEFPPMTEGEYWIEAVGSREYGLLDPFWTSEWDWRLPISIDNTAGGDLSEYQVFMEFDSSMTDFWTNVASDGSDIRFAQQISRSNFSNEGTAEINWFDTDFSHRLPITIPAFTVTEDQVDFPVYIDLAMLDATFWANVKTDGGDIRVTKADGTELAIDLVEFDTTAETGELHFLADMIVASAANTFYLYYGNSGASLYASSDPLGSEAVWVDYAAVFHFSEDPTTIGNTILDSTGSGRNVIVTTAALATTTGQMGTALDMTVSATGFLQNTAWTFPGGEPLITTGLYYQNSLSNESLWQWGTGAQPNTIEFRPWYTGTWTNGTGYHAFGVTAGATYSFARATTTWNAFGTIGTTTIGAPNLVYENGILVETVNQTVGNPTNTNVNGFRIGREGTGGSWNGYVDELRIATTTRGTERVVLETQNLFNPTNFYTIGASQVPDNAANLNWYSTSWDGRLGLSIPQAKVYEDLTDYPVFLDLSLLGSEFFDRVATDGSDIRITAGDGVTELPYELVSINTSLNTGELYFKTDLNTNDANDFYVYFDNEDAIAYVPSSTYGAENVWTNNFLAVYHLGEEVAGIGNANAYFDSTSNAYHGTDNIVSTGQSGKLGAGKSFGYASNNDFISLPRDVLNGRDTLTSSWWLQSTSTATQVIVSGARDTTAAGLDELLYYYTNNVPRRLYAEFMNVANYRNLTTDYNNGGWHYYHVSSHTSTNQVTYYQNGVSQLTQTITIDPLSIANGGLVIGQEQGTIGGSFTANRLLGNLDELRFADVTRSANWIRTEYANMNNVATFIATSTTETLAITDFAELDYWIQHFDYASQEADIWVKIDSLPAGEVSDIYMYYGATGVETTSNEMDTFSYSTSTDLFYTVNNGTMSQISVVSLIDNNEVSLNGGSAVALQRGERTTFTAGLTGSSRLSALGPISGTITQTSTDGKDTIVPIAFATTTFAIPTNRGTERWYVYAPFATSTVSTYIGNSGTPNQTQVVNTGATVTFTANPAGSDGVMIESDYPVLVTQQTTTGQDGQVAYPLTTRDLFGVRSGSVYLSASTTGANPSVECSSGSTGTVTGPNRGAQLANTTCSSTSEGAGNAVRFYGQTEAISAIQQGDGDGNETTVFWPQHEFGTEYSMTNSTAYVTIVCSPRFGEVEIAIVDSTNTVATTTTCTPTATAPGKAFFTAGGDTEVFAAGHRVLSTNGVPFYSTYEDITVDQDEKNIIGAVQARKFDGQVKTQIFGAQESAVIDTFDESIEQLSFAWYENNDLITPVDLWPLADSETVAEGQAISGVEAIEENDILRLRMNARFTNATTTAGTRAFTLQYGEALSAGQCSDVATWLDVGAVGELETVFSGYNIASIEDGTDVPSTLLASSTIEGTFEERNYSDFVSVDVDPNEIVEWDWVIKANEVGFNTTYCFRMVRASKHELESYTLYPELITSGPPDTPINVTYFDNEHTTEVSPILTFVASDAAGDSIHYQVQVATSSTFSNILIDRNSDTHFLNFENVSLPSDKAPFNSGQVVSFTSPTSLATSSTYWYRVRASDPDGSATTSDWSVPTSFSINDTLTVSEWYQTTGEQFSTNTLSDVSTSTTNASVSGSGGLMTSSPIYFSKATIGNAWGDVSWSDTETSGEIRIQVQYNNNGSWQLIPNVEIPGNDLGATTSPINLRALDTSTYGQIRLVANFDGSSLTLHDWRVTWSLRVDTPTLGTPFDNEKIVSTLPVFTFVTTDPQGDDLEYEFSISTDKDFVSSSSTFNSSLNAGFANTVSGGDTDPFNSGDTISYTAQSALTNGLTYWWRVRAKDPAGGDSWSPWSVADSFTVDTGVTVSTWYQTTKEQFEEGGLVGTIASTSGSITVNNNVGEYGTVNVTNGTWTTVNLGSEYNNPIVVASVRYNRTTDAQRTARVRNKTATSFEVRATNHNGTVGGSTVIDYIVVEAGDYEIDGGARVVAGTQSVSAVASRALPTNPGGTIVTFSPAFSSAPTVLTTITSDNDTTWAVPSIYSGTNKNNSPTASEVRLFLNMIYNTPAVHAPEDVDYIAIEQGHGTNNGSEYDSASVGSVGSSPLALTFSSAFSSAPQVMVVQQQNNVGGDGGYALVHSGIAQTTTNMRVAIDEDGVAADRAHGTSEVVSVWAFENSSGNILRLDSGDLSGTVASENIIFTDGGGPKYDNLDWNVTTPGASTLSMQLEYESAPGIYSLIPNSAIPGNSAGTTTSPIDLTDVNIGTYGTIRALATLECDGTDCPTLNSWQLEWSEGVNVYGTLRESDLLTNVASGTIRLAVNGTPVLSTGTVASGVWSLNNVTAFAGDVVTVWVDSASSTERAVTTFTYSGTGDMTGVDLYESHLAIGADNTGVITNTDLASYDNSISGLDQIFFNVDGSNNLDVCATTLCDEFSIYIRPGSTFDPATTSANVFAHNLVNNGTFEMGPNNISLSGSWTNNATVTPETSTITFTKATGTIAIDTNDSTINFHNLVLSSISSANLNVTKALDLSGSLTIASGTLTRASSSINVAGGITTGIGGFWTGFGTTTFDGTGAQGWIDNNPVSQNIGQVIIDGASVVVTASTDVTAYDIRIGSNDTLVGSSANNIYLAGDFVNAGTYNASQGAVVLIADNRTYPPLIPGSADWYADTDFEKRLAITVQPAQVPSSQTNFPVYVNLANLNNNFWSNVETDGRDIRVTANDGQTELPIDLVSLNTTNKRGELHFLAPNISGSTTTTFYIYFNNPSAVAYEVYDPYGRNAVWVDYEAVYHFEEDPTALFNTISDASGNGYDLFVTRTVLATSTGQLGVATNLVGSTGYLNNTDFTWTAGNPLMTSGWYKAPAVTNQSLWQWGTGAQPNTIEFRPWYTANSGYHAFGVTSGADYVYTPRDGTSWHHFLTNGATTTGVANTTYENGSLRDSVNQTVANPSNTNINGLQVGRNGTSAGSFEGEIDELRISTILRSGDWATAEYNNQKNPHIFYATSSVQNYVPDQVVDEATHNLTLGVSSLYDLVINDAVTPVAFTEAVVTISNNFEVATGTVTLPSTRLAIGRSFTNNGTFLHNNAEVRLTGTGANTITQNASEFLNHFYDLRLTGTGSWAFTDTNATTTNDIVLTAGTLTMPSGTMLIGGTLNVSGTGVVNANSGTVHFSSEVSETVTTRTSSLNNVLFGLVDSTYGWYDNDWSNRIEIKVASTSVSSSLVNFPVYVDLGDLGSDFWSNVTTDGSDIRITTVTGRDEVPVDLVEFSYGAETGELHFLAPSLSSVTDTTFYIYFGNADAEAPAIDSTYGRHAVWAGYEAVYHFTGDPSLGVEDASGRGRDLVATVGLPLATSGQIGGAVDMTSSSVVLANTTWTWPSGYNLISSGWYYQTAADDGAVWEFGTTCGANNGTCLSFMPWYTGTTGYHRFGVTTADTFAFTRTGSVWRHFTTVGMAAAGGVNRYYEDSLLRGSVQQTAPAQNPTNTGLQLGRYTTATYMNVLIDELRFSSTTRNQSWITTEYNNQSNSSSFYATSSETYLDVVPSFTVNQATATIAGDLIIYNANVIAPTNTLSIGGSALNITGSFNPNNATTTFNSTDIGEVVDFGNTAFHNLSFNGVGGGWEIATTTVNSNLSLVTGADFTLATGTTLVVEGRFSNTFASANTTWTDTTLVLSGGDYVVTGRTDAGDDYATLEISDDSDITIWNSSATEVVTRDISSLYMPDYDAIDGQLHIYGDYVRNSGTEYWSYARDFDGTSLTGGNERAVNVLFGRGSSALFATSSTLEIVGIASATSSVSSLSGIYSLQANNATLDIEYASFENLGPNGLHITNGTAITQLENSIFNVSAGRSGITVDADTMDEEPSSIFAGVSFATSSENSIYDSAWNDQIIVTILASEVASDLVDFPVYVNLTTLGSNFWTNVTSDGRDIRVTTDAGLELPIDLVEFNNTTDRGELYFLAPYLSASDNTSFYIHYNNSGAVAYNRDDEFGAYSVWSNYEAVYHFNENPTIQISDMTGNNRDLYPLVGTPATSTGLIGTSLDTTAGNVMVGNNGWTWLPGDDLVSSGLYYMSGFDTGALWQFGAGNGTNNGTYLSFMPWYDNATRGYHFFGITSGGDYNFSRNNAIWHHFTTIGRATDGANNEFYEDNILRDSVTQITSSANPANTGLRIGAYQTTTYMDIDIDELRFTKVLPSTAWIDFEYQNFTSPTTTYATSTLPTTQYNVSVAGNPGTFWRFENGTGSLYGENFDNDDGDPGVIQWDDSNFAVAIGGVVYGEDGVTPIGYPVCNGSTEVVTVVLDGVDTFTAPCDPVDSSYTVSGVSFSGEPKITTYINSNATFNQVNVSILDEVTGTGTTASNLMNVSRGEVVDDSVLVLIAGKDDDINWGAPPSGWVSVNQLGNTTGDNIASGVWYKVVTNAVTEPASYSFPVTDNGEGYSYWLGTLVNVSTTTPVDVASTWTKLQGPIVATSSSITTVTNGALVLSAWYTYADDHVTLPSNEWSTRASVLASDPTPGNNLGIVSKVMETAGATGDAFAMNTNFTSGREVQSGQFAFRPASSPLASSSITAVALSKTPLGNQDSANDIVTLRDQFVGVSTVPAFGSFSVKRPEVETGDVLIMAAGKEDDPSITAPAGWTLAGGLAGTLGNQVYSAVWYKVVANAGTEPASYSFTSNDDSVEEYSYWIGSFSGVDTSNVFATAVNWTNLQDTSSPVAPSVTVPTANSYAMAVWYMIDDATFNMPGGVWQTLAQDLQTNNRNLLVAGRLMTSTGATGGATATGGSTDDGNVIQFALRPAPIAVRTNITNMDLYQNQVIVRHEDSSPLDISDLVLFDNDDESDLPFVASTSTSPDNLTILPGNGLLVWSNRTFAPSGEVILSGAGAGVNDGTLTLANTATLTLGSDDLNIGGSLRLGTGAVLSASSTSVEFTATNPGQVIASLASSTATFGQITFSGVGGGWVVATPLVSNTSLTVATGTLAGIANVTVTNGNFSGDGVVDMTAGTVTVARTNNFGGVNPWSFHNLTLGNGSVAGVTTPLSTATTTVRNVLTVATAHFLDAGSSVFDLQGNGNVFMRNGTFLEDTSTVRYSGATPNVLSTNYSNLVINPHSGGSVTGLASATGFQVLGNLTIGTGGTSTLNLATNNPVLSVAGNVEIGDRGTLSASASSLLTVLGNWNNNGTFVANNGTVNFARTINSATINPGSSSFANLTIGGTSDYTIASNATVTANMTINTQNFIQQSGTVLAIGGTFTNSMNDNQTTWSGTELHLYSGTPYTVNTKTRGDTYDTLRISNNTHVRVWNATTTSLITEDTSSLYSMDNEGVDGYLLISGNYTNTNQSDYWSYETDFDGTTGVSRRAVVEVVPGGSITYNGGSLSALGTSTASTTIGVQGSGTYDFTITGTSTASLDTYIIRDTTIGGLTITGTPTISTLSRGDFEVAIAEGSAITVNGTAIDANPAKNFTANTFATTTAINAYNVTATGSSGSSWRFVNVLGNMFGEAFDNDPAGDPGYVVWEDSAAIINISGRVYSDEGVTVSSVCDDVTPNIFLSIGGLTFASTTCASATGDYVFTGVGFGPSDTLTVYISGETEQAANVTKDPISSISNMNLYENRVIVRDESATPMTIEAMSVWDSSDDADIPFTAVNGGTDTLDLPTGFKLIVWTGKTFDPNGNITLPGGVGSENGKLELQTNSTFLAGDATSHSIGGDLVTGTGAVFTAETSTIIFTSTISGRSVDTNEASFHNLSFTSSGTWTFAGNILGVNNDLSMTAGTITLPTATTTIGGSFNNNGGAFVHNNSPLVFTATDSGNIIRFGGSDTRNVTINGVGGSWTMSDANATTTENFIHATGTLSLPTGQLNVGNNFVNTGNLTHNSGTIRLYGTSGGNILTTSNQTIGSLTVEAGAGDYTLTDVGTALAGSLNINSGSFTVGTGTLSIAGSLNASTGVFNHGTGTVLFNASASGRTINMGNNPFYNVIFAGSGAGAWTISENATTTNNFTITSGSSFTMAPDRTLYVGGIFTNTLGGSNTVWTNSTLILDAGTEFTINSKSSGVEVYGTLILGEDTDVRMWKSSASTTTVPASSSLYSMNHNNISGDLNIYGDFNVGTSTEHWSYATDFDGVALGGSSRLANVNVASSSSVTLLGTGNLQMVGISTASTTVSNQGTGRYSLSITGGTFNASYYQLRDMVSLGLNISGSPVISSLSRGDIALSANNGSLITLTDAALNNNAGLSILNTRLNSNGYTGGVSVNLNATTTNSWYFTGPFGDLWGEDYDEDGDDTCGSVRFDDSTCLLTEQTSYIWRNDDGGEGAPNSSWFDFDWDKRAQVRVVNTDFAVYASTSVKVVVPYDSDMQTDFDDLRFTREDGVTPVPYWIERVQTGVEAVVWVVVPTLPSNDASRLYMYYGNGSASSGGNIANVFDAYDNFEDNNISEYSGNTSMFATNGTFAYGGSYGVAPTPGSVDSRTTTGIGRTDITVGTGDRIRYMQYIDTSAGATDEACTLFGVQSPVSSKDNYAVCLELFGTDRISLVKDAESTDTYGGVVRLASSTVSYTTGWYEVSIDWNTNNVIIVDLFNPSGVKVASINATDTSYSSGGVGFAFWGQHGGWDTVVAYPRTRTLPAVYLGDEQIAGGASYASEQDVATNDFDLNEVARLRVAIENTGLDITAQNFRLEFAPKGVAPSCLAVSSGSFVSVPNVASCGSSAVCMATSSHITNDSVTTDLLLVSGGDFSAGKIVANTTNETTDLDVLQNRYTEIEYALRLTNNATDDAYCFRVTDGGALLDSYANLPEISLSFDPVLSTVNFNDGLDIVLNAGTTTVVIATTTVTDYNGFSDLASATTTFFKTSVGASCTLNDNNCYRATSTCSFNNCSGATCDLVCRTNFAYHTEPTDDDGGEEWFAFMEVQDTAGGVDFVTSNGLELLTLRALNTQNAINYGTVDINGNTGTYNPDVILVNIGNEDIDVNVAGTAMSDGQASVIPASQQIFATSTFDYATCVSCETLSEFGIDLPVDLTKPTAMTPPVTDSIYWGVSVPFGIASNPHTGINTFMAISGL